MMDDVQSSIIKINVKGKYSCCFVLIAVPEFKFASCDYAKTNTIVIILTKMKMTTMMKRKRRRKKKTQLLGQSLVHRREPRL